MTNTPEIWTYWEFDTREDAEAAVETIRHVLEQIPGVTTVEAAVQPPTLGIGHELITVITVMGGVITVRNTVDLVKETKEVVAKLAAKLKAKSATIKGGKGEPEG